MAESIRSPRAPWFRASLAALALGLTQSLHAGLAHPSLPPPPLERMGTAELCRLRLLPELLAPMGREPSAEENAGLVRALRAFTAGQDAGVLEASLRDHPNSPWAPALLLNVGLLRFDAGHYSVALAAWTRAWQLGRQARAVTPAAEALRVRAAAEAIRMNCRVGRVAEAKALLAELGQPDVRGRNATLLADARQAIAQMETLWHDSFKCGPYALSSILIQQRAHTLQTQRAIAAYATTPQGTSLSEVEALSRQLGLKLRPARRLTAEAPIPLPAVVHWKLQHYGALLARRGDRYLLNDPTFGTAQWIKSEALASEPSGYFLLPSGPLPEGWAAVESTEAATVWGRGNCATGDGSGAGPDAPRAPGCGGGRGMAVWSINLALATLHLNDTPIAYQPPVGPGVAFALNYSAVEQNQPTLIDYSHVGPLWNFSLLSYITAENEGSGNVQIHSGGGGLETYYALVDPGDYTPDQQSGARLARISPTHYERLAGDGSKLVYDLLDPAGRLFLTRVVDPQGNALTLSYDADFRLVSVTDAIGQVSTLTHGSNTPGDPQFYLVTRFTDPFGRFATLTYTDGQLTGITDQIGLTSQFAYTAGFVTQMTTPYGVTHFDGALTTDPERGNIVHLEVTEPNGAKQRVESVQNQPTVPPENAVPADMPTLNGFLTFRNSFYWDRKAMAEAPGDYSRARLTHFLHHNGGLVKSNIPESRKEPLEGRVWFEYQDNPTPALSLPGMRANPTFIGRVLDDGSTRLERFSYNALGNLTQRIDPLGRTTQFVYAANGIDLLQTNQLNARAGWDRLLTLTWNAQHRPLTATDVGGATTTFTYNARGQMLSATNARGESVLFTYNPQGYLLSYDGPLPGPVDRMVFTYDGFGRRSSATDPDGYTLTYSYDALDRLTIVTFPDGTSTQFSYTNLDQTQVRDRLGNVTTYAYNSVRQLTGITEPLSRVTTLEWCLCGGLERMVDPLGRTTEWVRDIQGRITARKAADGRQEKVAYEGRTSRVLATTDARGQTAGYFYQTDDALAGIYYPGAEATTPSVSFTYDRAYPRALSMADGTGLTTYAYGAVTGGVAPDANLLTEIRTGWTNSRLTFAYDELSRVVTRSVDGSAQNIVRDAAGRTTLVHNALGNFDFTYEGSSSRIAQISYPNGMSTTAAYFGNAGDRRLQQTQNFRPGGTLLSRFDYTYDGAGRVLTWTQQADSAPAVNFAFTYDAVGQLTAASAPGRSLTFSYDKAGNLLTRALNAAATSLAYSAVNELQHVAPSLGADKSYTWDAANRLIRIDYAGGSLHTRFAYDGLGRCVEIAEWNGTTQTSSRRYVWCGQERCEERESSGSVTRRFFGLGEQVGGVSFFYTFDHLGSVREMLDGAGNLRARYDYDPFGGRTRLAGDLEATRGFAGMVHHLPSSLGLTRFRAYDAATGRWLSRDPLGERGGQNLYAYVGNAPTTAVDPSGLYAAFVGGNVGGYAILPAVGASGGLAFDTSGNFGGYGALSGGAQLGVVPWGAGAGFEFGFSGAPTARDAIENTMFSISVGAALGGKLSIALGYGQTADGQGFLTGTLGVGIGTPSFGGSITTGPAAYGPLVGPDANPVNPAPPAGGNPGGSANGSGGGSSSSGGGSGNAGAGGAASGGPAAGSGAGLAVGPGGGGPGGVPGGGAPGGTPGGRGPGAGGNGGGGVDGGRCRAL